MSTGAAPAVVVPRRSLALSLPPHAYFVVSAIFHYLGPAFAVLLFVRVEPLGVAWFRIVSAAVILASGDDRGAPSPAPTGPRGGPSRVWRSSSRR